MNEGNNKKIRVLVVDDSALMRKKLSEMINSDDACEVIATARNGEEAIRTVAGLKPDVVTLDVELPKMDGITALKYIMSEWPTPIVMVTAYSEYRGEDTIKCLEYGAVDLVEKPSGVISLDINKVRDDLLSKIKIASHVHRLPFVLSLDREKHVAEKKRSVEPAEKIVVIASSTGGPRALEQISLNLPSDIKAAVLMIQHMPWGFTHAMAERLDGLVSISVHEARAGEELIKGKILIAPGGFQLRIEKKGNQKNVKLIQVKNSDGICPSADIAMKSIAPIFGEKCLGIILTGMGNDGVEGFRAIKQFGGHTISEDESTSIVYGMPKVALESGWVDEVLPLDQIAPAIIKWVEGKKG